MPAGPFVAYDKWANLVHSSAVNVATASYKLALFTSASNADTKSNDEFADLTNQVSGNGYTAGGVALSGVSVAISETRHSKFTASNLLPGITASGGTITFRFLVVYVVGSGGGLTNPLVCVSTWLDNTGNPTNQIIPDGVGLNVTWESLRGILRLRGTPIGE